MAQNYETWPSYLDVQEQLTAAGIPLRTATPDTFYTRVIDAIVSEFERKTHRQFIADTEDRTKKFDGSGGGEQLVDDMVSLTEVTISGWIGIGAFDITNAVLLEESNYPRNKIIIAEGPPYQFNHGVFTRFPEGRANIQVTGKFGYGTYIPDSAWMAVLSRSSTVMASHFLGDSNTGRIINSWIEGSSSEKYADGDFKQIGEIQGWISMWRNAIQDFNKPLSERRKSNRRPMI